MLGKLRLESVAEIDSSHYLKDYDGKCANLHGHRWKIKVVVEGFPEYLDKAGMLIDFGKIKDIINAYDHALFVFEPDKEELERVVKFFDSKGFKRIEILPFNSTAENLAMYLAEDIMFEMTEEGLKGNLVELSVWETPNNKVSYFPDMEE